MHSSSSSDYDQNQFFDDNDANGHGLDDDGFIFIPSRSEIIWPVYNDIWTHCIFKSNIIVVKMGQLNVISMSIFMAVLWWVNSKDHQTLLVSNTKMCQERSWLGDGYVQRLGFLGLAEENNIVMMFPQVSFVHHNGTREWFFVWPKIYIFRFNTLLSKGIQMDAGGWNIKESLKELIYHACRDWWGYLGDREGMMYATKMGRQMEGVAKMVQRVTNMQIF